MGKVTGFLEIERADHAYEAVASRLKHYKEFVIPIAEDGIAEQAARCMDCGIPFCQTGCPVNNIIPDWNDLVYRDNWRHAIEVLHSTNNFPEFTGRICPAPCEAACTLNLNDDAVTIKSIELAIVEHAWQNNWILPQPPAVKTGKAVAVVGSGPSGMACAQQLARAGHAVTLFEKNEKIGGLLRFGIPDFKMEKHFIDRRVAQMQAEGVVLATATKVGGDGDISTDKLLAEFDAVVLSGGSEHPRDLPIPGRQLAGVHFAMEFLPQQNRRLSGLAVNAKDILATDKNVVVIGGGDTGSDCIGTSRRQNARQIVQLELLPQPPGQEDKLTVWPHWPLKMRTSTSQEEGCDRQWSVLTKEFIGNERVEAIKMVKVEWATVAGGQMQMQEVAGSEFTLQADLVLLAMGYLHPKHEGLIDDLAVTKDARGNVQADEVACQTSVDKVFSAGDMRRGQSLVVWAIREGRQCARAVDTFLMGDSCLPS